MEEIFVPVKGFEEYKISNLGRILGKKGQLLNPWKDASGYLRTEFYQDGISYGFAVHRLVAEAFIPNPENKPEVNHKKGIKIDCRVTELEWATCQENQDHAVMYGLKCRGERQGSAKLKNTDIPIIRELLQSGISQRVIARQYGVTHHTIGLINRNKRWRYA